MTSSAIRKSGRCAVYSMLISNHAVAHECVEQVEQCCESQGRLSQDDAAYGRGRNGYPFQVFVDSMEWTNDLGIRTSHLSAGSSIRWRGRMISAWMNGFGQSLCNSITAAKAICNSGLAGDVRLPRLTCADCFLTATHFTRSPLFDGTASMDQRLSLDQYSTGQDDLRH
jgi:hypothetical protein